MSQFLIKCLVNHVLTLRYSRVHIGLANPGSVSALEEFNVPTRRPLEALEGLRAGQ